MSSARPIAVLVALALAAVPAAAAPEVRTATPRDDGAHADVRTEWWFVNAIDPASGLAVAAALGTRFPSAPPATVVFVYPPGGGRASTVASPRRITAPPGTAAADVRLGGDRLWSPRPGVWRLRMSTEGGLVLSGPPPGRVALDLTFRATAPGFVAGPMALPGGQDLSWTVGAPSARVDGTVTIGGRAHRLRGAPGYHDHNFGRFDLADPAHGGWDWSQVHLPGGRSLVTGIVRPRDPRLRDGVTVLSRAGRRTAVARAGDVTVRRGAWSAVDGRAYPRRLEMRARMSGGWRARVEYRARRASPLLFTANGDSALMEIEARSSGVLLRRGRVVARWSDAPGFYEYESTPVTRERDGAPGSLTWAGRQARRTALALDGL